MENFLSFAKLLAMGCNTNFGGYGNSAAHFTPNEESYAQQGLEWVGRQLVRQLVENSKATGGKQVGKGKETGGKQ